MKAAAIIGLALFLAACGGGVYNASGPYDPAGWQKRQQWRGSYKLPSQRRYTYSRRSRPQPYRQPSIERGKVWESPCDPEIMPKPAECQ